MNRTLRLALIPLALSALLVSIFPFGSRSQQQPATNDQPLPVRPTEVVVEAHESPTYRIAVPAFTGISSLGPMAADVIKNDFRYSGAFQVIDARQYPGSGESEGLTIHRNAWTAIGAQGVVKAQVRAVGNQLELEARLFEVGRVASDEPTLTRTYRGTEADLRRNVHLFANEVLLQITGKPGAFDTRLVFARRPSMGRKDVQIMDYDGANLRRISNGEGIAMLPTFGPTEVWYSRLTEFGMFITNSSSSDRPLIESEGLNMGITICDDRMYFTSTREGNPEIYSARLDGRDVRRLTNHPSIDVSPACGPNNQLAFVSDRHGGPQVFVMARTGGEPRRVTFRGSHNQTPAWCQDPAQPLLAFTGRDEGMDVFTVNVATGAYVRITQAQGLNKDPTFSPDCRMIAFYSSRQGGGVYLSNPSGFNQHRVLDGHAETLRWEPRPEVSAAARRAPLPQDPAAAPTAPTTPATTPSMTTPAMTTTMSTMTTSMTTMTSMTAAMR